MNEHVPTITEQAGALMERVIIQGDLSRLTPLERSQYYNTVCQSIGLNPLTKPFEYITLNGKLTLYARKDCTDQLRKMHRVSVTDMTETERDGVTVVTVKVQDTTGRTDMAKGAVSLGNLKGEALANAIMKAETKAKRRATLSICGLGFLDETEVETIPGARPEPRVLKKDHRADYHTMLAELDHTLDLEEWFNTNGARVAALPPEWRTNIDAVIASKCADPTVSSGEILADGWSEKQGDGLRTATQVHAPEPPAEIWDDAPAEESDWDKLGPVKQAGTLCSDRTFYKFLDQKGLAQATDVLGNADGVTWEDIAKVSVYDFCNITSRKELAHNADAAKLWRALVADYRAWQRLPAVVDQPSPRREEVGVADQGAPAASHHQTMAEAPEVPTAELYTAMWDSIILGATPTQAKQIHTLWGNQAALRRQIEWTEAHQPEPLTKHVKDALAFLKGSK